MFVSATTLMKLLLMVNETWYKPESLMTTCSGTSEKLGRGKPHSKNVSLFLLKWKKEDVAT